MKQASIILVSSVVLTAMSFGPAASERHLVSQKDRKFRPSQLTIATGDVVVFQNDDETDHHIMARKGPTKFSSRLLLRGASYEVTFERVGTWKIGCRIHPRMRLMVKVVEGSKPER